MILRLLTCTLLASILLTSVACRGYAVSVGGGWRDGGPWGGVSIIPLPDPVSTGLPDLQQAGKALDALVSPAGSSGKTPAPAVP